MENEASILDKIADIFDTTLTKNPAAGRCERCATETPHGTDIYCVRCAVAELRALAKHLRQYL